MNDFMFFQIITSLFGTAGMVFWLICRYCFDRTGRIESSYFLFKVLLLLYVIPLPSLFVIFGNHKLLKLNFQFYSFEIGFEKIFFLVWVIGVVLLTGEGVREFRIRQKLCKNCFPCENEVIEMFSVSKKAVLGSCGKVSVDYSYAVPAPVLVGLLRPKILLPPQKYTEHQLQVVFLHELIHLKNHDNWYRILLTGIRILHFYNPFVWLLDSYQRIYAEYVCDEIAARQSGGMRNYFEMIQTIILADDSKKIEDANGDSMDEELIKRVKHAKHNKEIEHLEVSRWLIGIVLGVFICLVGILGFWIAIIKAEYRELEIAHDQKIYSPSIGSDCEFSFYCKTLDADYLFDADGKYTVFDNQHLETEHGTYEIEHINFINLISENGEMNWICYSGEVHYLIRGQKMYLLDPGYKNED